MDSQPGISREASKRITRSWYPGGRARRTTDSETAATPSRDTSGLGTEVGYWGRVDTDGEFEEGSGFLAPFAHAWFPWRWLLSIVRRVLPLSVAALVGAVTALAWQSFMIRPAPSPAARPTLPVPAAQTAPAMGPTNAPESAPASPLPIPAGTSSRAAPATARPAPQPLLGSASSAPPLLGPTSSVAASRPASVVERTRSARPITRQAVPARLRAPAGRVTPNRAARPAGAPARSGASPDPDAILRPSFM